MGAETKKKCPYCAEEILPEAIKCKHCGTMLDGSDGDREVVIRGVEPLAELHTPIRGKKPGELTGIGMAGIGLGIIFLLACVFTLPSSKVDGLDSLIMGLWGLGFIIASYLWARSPSKGKQDKR